MNSEEQKIRDRKEFKEFLVITIGLFAVLFFVMKIYSVSYADEVVLAEAPFIEVGEENEGSFVIDIVSDANSGNQSSDSQQAPAIIYVDSSSDKRGTVSDTVGVDVSERSVDDSDELDKQSGSNVLFADGSHNQSNETSITDEIYVPDSDDDCPVSDKVPLPIELQEYLWTKCKKATGDYKNYYAFCLGVMELESTFRTSATHYNKNGTVDRGIMQINSSNVGKMKKAGLISSCEDLYNAYKCIDCGVHMLNNYISKFGVSESAYYAYNTGKEHQGSNKNSRKVMQNMSKWNCVVFG